MSPALNANRNLVALLHGIYCPCKSAVFGDSVFGIFEPSYQRSGKAAGFQKSFDSFAAVL